MRLLDIEKITYNLVKSFLSCSLIKKSDFNIITFNTSSYIKLKNYKNASDKDILTIFKHIIYNIEIGEEHIIPVGSYIINGDTIYIKTNSQNEVIDLKFIYCPYKTELSKENCIENIMYELNSIYNNKYINSILLSLKTANLEYFQTIKEIENSIKELNDKLYY